MVKLSPDDEQISEREQHAGEVLRKMQAVNEIQRPSDVILLAGSDSIRIPAHKAVLAAHSDYFSGMFSGAMREASMDEVPLQQVDGAALKTIVDGMYSGSIEITSEILETVLRTADYLQAQFAVEACCEYILQHLNKESGLKMLRIVRQYPLRELHDRCLNVVCKHFNEICTQDEFLQLDEDHLGELLSLDEVCVPSETVVFRSLARWVEFDSKRKESLLPLLQHVRPQFLSPKFINEQKDFVRGNPDCEQLLEQWLQQPTGYAIQRRLSGKIELLTKFLFEDKNLKLQTYDLATGEWSIEDLPGLPVVWSEVLTFVGTKNKLIFALSVLDSEPFINLSRLDLKTKEWTCMLRLPSTTFLTNLTELNGSLYIIGCDKMRWSKKTVLHKYDVPTNTWIKTKALPKTVGWASRLVALDGLLYVVSSKNGDVFSFDPRLSTWTRKASRNEANNNFGLTAGNGYLYTVAGYFGRTISGTVEQYDPTKDSWTLLPPLQYEIFNLKCFVIGEQLIACGGNDMDRCCKLVQIYNPFTYVWKDVATIPFSRTYSLYPIVTS